MPPDSSTRFDPQRILEMLARHEVQCVVIGGYAALLAGIDILTRDIDITPRSVPHWSASGTTDGQTPAAGVSLFQQVGPAAGALKEISAPLAAKSHLLARSSVIAAETFRCTAQPGPQEESRMAKAYRTFRSPSGWDARMPRSAATL